MKKIALALALLFSVNANALTLKEKEHLTLLMKDIEILMHDAESIKDRFSSQSDPKKFNYQVLIDELNLVRDGINRRVVEKSNQPVNFDVIKADY